MFDRSIYRKAWLIDGKASPRSGRWSDRCLSATGMIWLAFSGRATKYPLAMTKLMQRQLAEIMLTKRHLITTIMDGDLASERFAISFRFCTGDRWGLCFAGVLALWP